MSIQLSTAPIGMQTVRCKGKGAPRDILLNAICLVLQAWKGIGGKSWLFGDECRQQLRNFMSESLGVSLPDSMSDRAVDYVYQNGG